MARRVLSEELHGFELPTEKNTIELNQLGHRFRGIEAVFNSVDYGFLATFAPVAIPPPPDPTRACVRHPNHQSKR